MEFSYFFNISYPYMLSCMRISYSYSYDIHISNTKPEHFYFISYVWHTMEDISLKLSLLWLLNVIAICIYLNQYIYLFHFQFSNHDSNLLDPLQIFTSSELNKRSHCEWDDIRGRSHTRANQNFAYAYKCWWNWVKSTKVHQRRQVWL